MSTTTEKQATGFEMTSSVGRSVVNPGTHFANVMQNGRLVFIATGCSSRQHAERIARDIMVQYGTVERPTI